MSAKLLILALVCAVAYVQAGSIARTPYATADCTGEPLPFQTQNMTAGDCMAAGTTSFAYFFDASNVYAVSYFNNTCASTLVSGVTQYPIGCAKTAFGVAFTTEGTSPALPFGTFPPSGFSTSSSFVNVTEAGAKNAICSVATGVVEVKSASATGYCNVRSAAPSITTPSSTAGYCSSTGSASVTFSDNTCSTPVAGSSKPYETCTVSGSVAGSSSCGAGTNPPEGLPTQGYTLYTNADCTSAAPTTVYIGSACFDSQTLVCGVVNGTDGYATYSYFQKTATGADGSCGTQVEAASQSVLAGTCVPYPAGSTTTFRKYFCAGTGPGASASTASVSVVATLIAAVAAVFAVRSL